MQDERRKKKMKKILLLSSILLSGLVACGGSKEPTKPTTPSIEPTPTQSSNPTPSADPTAQPSTPTPTTKEHPVERDLSINLLCPTGAPAAAFYTYANNSKFETNNVPTNIVGEMTSTSKYEAIVIDTTSGIKAINNGAPYKLAATLTFGNFYLVSTSEENTTIDANDNIVLFGTQAAVPYSIFHYLYDEIGLDSIEFVTNVQNAAACLVTGKNAVTGNDVDWVFVAQPVLNNVLNNPNAVIHNKNIKIINIQDEYKAKTNNKELMQASLFIKNSADKTTIDNFLSTLKEDITYGLANVDHMLEGYSKVTDANVFTAKFGVPLATLEAVLPTNLLGLGYATASERIDEINSYIGLFNMGEISEEIIYQ